MSRDTYRNSVGVIYTCVIAWLLGFATAEYRTKEASQKLIDLYCYRCDTMEDGPGCQELKENSTSWQWKCPNDHRMCKVKSILMTASTEDLTGRAKLWMLQRSCTKTCEPGCIVIGERTKLHSCTACCEHNFCNIGSGSGCYTNHITNSLLAFKFLTVMNMGIFLL